MFDTDTIQLPPQSLLGDSFLGINSYYGCWSDRLEIASYDLIDLDTDSDV
jgi:hypothetical protein